MSLPEGSESGLARWTGRQLRSIRKATSSLYWLAAYALQPAGRRKPGHIGGRVRVMHLAAKGNVSGLTDVLKKGVYAQRAHGYEPSVCFIERGGPAADELSGLGLDVTVLQKRHFDARTIGELKDLMEARGVQVLHAHGFKQSIYGRFAAYMAGVPVIICHLHGDVKGAWRKLRPFGRMSVGMTDAFVALTETMRRDLLSGFYGYRPDPEKIFLVPNGVDTLKFAPAPDKDRARWRVRIPEGRPAIGMVGRASREKGHEVLLDALKLLREEGREFTAVFAGGGPLLRKLKEKAAGAGLEGSVIFMGERSDVEQILPALDVYAHPSLSDTLPVSLLEAMASGVPVVASRVGGIPQVVEDGVTGLLVEPGEPGVLASALGRLIGDPALSAKLGAAARLKVEEEFGGAAFESAMISLYEKLLKP